MNSKNGSKICIQTWSNSETNKATSVIQTPTENAEVKGNVYVCKYSKEAHPKSQTNDNIEDAKRKETPCYRPHSFQPRNNSKLRMGSAGESVDPQYKKPEWLDCLVQGCTRESCFDGMGVLPVGYSSPGKPCVPEYVHSHPPTDWNRRPQLPEPPEMLSTLKQGIRHPLQITQRRKEMQTHLDKLTDEHQAFAFPPGTRPFIDNAYYSTDPTSNLVENYDLICRDIGMQQFLECAFRSSLLAFNTDKYKFFRERLPMPQKRVLNIPGYRTIHWHNWIVRPLRTTYSESWRKDIKIPDNWFGPAPTHIC